MSSSRMILAAPISIPSSRWRAESSVRANVAGLPFRFVLLVCAGSLRTVFAVDVVNIGYGRCCDKHGRTYDHFYVRDSVVDVSSEARCVERLRQLNLVWGVVGAQWVPTAGEQRCRILVEDGVDPRDENILNTVEVPSGGAACYKAWDCLASNTDGAARGPIANVLDAVETVAVENQETQGTCWRLVNPAIRPVQTFSYHVKDGSRIEGGENAPAENRYKAIYFCSRTKYCSGFTCATPEWSHCYVTLSFNGSVASHEKPLPQHDLVPAPAHTRSYLKWRPPDEGEHRHGYTQTYMLLHHKGRSTVAFEVLYHMFAWLGLSVHTFSPDNKDRRTQMQPQCAQADVGVYYVSSSETVQYLADNCPPFRAVHVIRDPVDMLVSAYSYHFQSNDTLPNTGPTILQQLPVKRGVAVEAAAQLKHTIREMVGVHRLVKDDPRYLTVHSEGLISKYDETTLKITMHLYPELSVIQNFVRSARYWMSRYDARRCGGVTMANRALIPENHRDIKREAQRAVEELLAEKHPLLLRVRAARAVLGYGNRGHRKDGVAAKRHRLHAGSLQKFVIEPLSGAPFLTHRGYRHALSCQQYQGHFLLLDLGRRHMDRLALRSKIEPLLTQAPWLQNFTSMRWKHEMIGVCVKFELSCCELEVAWKFLLRHWSGESNPFYIPPLPLTRIRARTCHTISMRPLHMSFRNRIFSESLVDLLRGLKHPDRFYAEASGLFELPAQSREVARLSNQSSFWD